jgi:hypothetical protein
MAIGNFTPEIWAAKIFSDYDKEFVFGNVVNREYEGDIRAYGDTVRINALGPVSVGSWTKDSTTMTVQPLIGLDQTLVIDKADYFHFFVDDVDKAQNNPKVMGEAMRKAAVALAETADARIAGLYTEAGIVMTTQVTGPSVVVEGLARFHQKLDENNVPYNGRWLVVPPWYYSNMLLGGLGFAPSTNSGVKNIDATNSYEAGRLGRVMGFDIYMSNNLTEGPSHVSTTPEHYVMAGHRDAITFADQIASVEAYRPELQFADAVKGLHVYGMKCVQPKALAYQVSQYSTV